MSAPTTFRLVADQSHRWSAPLPHGGEIRYGESVPTEESFGISASILGHVGPCFCRVKVYHSLFSSENGDCAFYVQDQIRDFAHSIDDILNAQTSFRIYVSDRMPHGILLARIESIGRDRLPLVIPFALNPDEVHAGRTIGELIQNTSNVGFFYICAEENQAFRAGLSGKLPSKLLDLLLETWKAVDPRVPFDTAVRLTVERYSPEELWDLAEEMPAD